jgi:uncharacterized protein YndB with AHSA1/START domain
MASVKVKHATTYQFPPETVFAAITDVDLEPRWQPQVLRVWQEPAGPVTLGTRFGRERKIMGKVTVQLSKVVALEPNARVEMREQPGTDQPPFCVSYRLTPVGPDSTKLDFSLVIEGVPAIFASAVRHRLSGEVAGQFNLLGELLAAGAQ